MLALIAKHSLPHDAFCRRDNWENIPNYACGAESSRFRAPRFDDAGVNMSEGGSESDGDYAEDAAERRFEAALRAENTSTYVSEQPS